MHFCPRLPPSKLDVNLIFRMFMIGILSIGFVMDILKSYVYSQFYKLQWNLIPHPFSYPKSLKRAISRPYFLHKLLHQKISMARDAISFSGFSWTYRTLPYNSYAILESVVRPATLGTVKFWNLWRELATCADRCSNWENKGGVEWRSASTPQNPFCFAFFNG